MLHLQAKDGAKFYGTILTFGGQVRASYSVVLATGPDTQIERDVRMFPTESQASAWLQHEADERSFGKSVIDRG